MSDGDTVQATAAHQEYLAETRRLVDQQVEALAALVTAAAQQAATTAGAAGQQPTVTRQDHVLTVTNGARSASFEIQAITDLPEGTDRAHAFPTSQARCVVQAPNGETEEWILHRLDAGGDMPSYAWMRDRSETPIDAAEIALLLRSLFA